MKEGEDEDEEFPNPELREVELLEKEVFPLLGQPPLLLPGKPAMAPVGMRGRAPSDQRQGTSGARLTVALALAVTELVPL